MLSYFWFSVHETAGIESRIGDHESRSGEKEKPLITFMLNFTFMETQGQDLTLGLGFVNISTNTQININQSV